MYLLNFWKDFFADPISIYEEIEEDISFFSKKTLIFSFLFFGLFFGLFVATQTPFLTIYGRIYTIFSGIIITLIRLSIFNIFFFLISYLLSCFLKININKTEISNIIFLSTVFYFLSPIFIPLSFINSEIINVIFLFQIFFIAYLLDMYIDEDSFFNTIHIFIILISLLLFFYWGIRTFLILIKYFPFFF